MDIITQSLLGATLATSVAKKAEVKKAAIIGGLSGMLADADIFIQSSTDSLLTIEFHRHFTHSLVFIPVGALIATLLLWPFFKKHLSFGRIYLYSFFGYCMSGVLDACTSYGTHLLWPFSDERIAWHLISIIDPVFSLTLLLAIIFSLRRQSVFIARTGLVFAGLYMLLGVVQLQRTETIAEELAVSRGHQIERLVVKPTIGNLILWRSIYQAEGVFCVDAIRVGLGSNKLYPGSMIKQFDYAEIVGSVSKDSVLYKDIQRFEIFSDGYIALHPERNDIIGDVRYAMLPISVSPLWGIEFDRQQPQQHVDYRFDRNMTAAERKLFTSMLLGQQVDQTIPGL